MRGLPLLAFALALALPACGDAPADPCDAAPVSYTADVLPVVVAPYCLDCHSERARGESRAGAPAGLNFDRWALAAPAASALANAVTSGRMPPLGRPRPTREERALVERWRLCGFAE